jgi:phage/plasmid-like protein (TIGR03299 family)
MAHDLETHNGEVAFALRGAPAWHGLANRIFSQDEIVDTTTMMSESKTANWNVRLESIENHIPNEWNNNSESFLVLRDNPFVANQTDVLSVVGKRYKVVQNEDLFSFGDNILDGGAYWESAGSIKNGRVVFGSLVIPKEFTLDSEGANDKVVTYLVVSTSHDGSSGITAAITPVRVVCQNTLNLAIKSTKQSFKIRHTQTVDGKIVAAREALGLTFGYMDSFEKEARQLFEAKISDVKFNEIITAIYPKPTEEAKGSVKKWENKLDILNDLYFHSPTVETVKGTAWGAFNALTERLDYFRTERKGKSETMTAAASGFDPLITAEKNRILKVVKSMAVSA